MQDMDIELVKKYNQEEKNMTVDFTVNGQLVEMEEGKTTEDEKILKEYYERLRKQNEGKGSSEK